MDIQDIINFDVSEINSTVEVNPAIRSVLDAPRATALIAAVIGGISQLDAARQLLQSGCDTEIWEECGGTALVHSIAERQPEMFELLLDNGADVDGKTGFFESKALPIILAVAHNINFAVVRLLSEGCDVNALDADGDTPLHYALRMDKPTIARKLRTFGGNSSLKNHLGLTPSDLRTPVETPVARFDDFDFDDSLLRGIYDFGYQSPTPIQQVVLRPLCQGADLAMCSPRGTGKTASLAISILSRIDPSQPAGLQALVICGSREVTSGIDYVISHIGEYRINKHSVQMAIGGVPIRSQQLAIATRSTSIVIGTPGRLLDLLSRGILKLARAKCVHFNGIDDQINLGFSHHIMGIIFEVPESVQLCLTMCSLPTNGLGIKIMNKRKFLFVFDTGRVAVQV